MKKILVLSTVAIAALLFMSFNMVLKSNSNIKSDKYEVPEDIQLIIDNTCKGCHVSDSKNIDGREELSWDKMKNGYKTYEVVAKLMDIAEVLEEKEMPPEKFLVKYPEKNISEDDSKKLHDWAKKMAAKLSE